MKVKLHLIQKAYARVLKKEITKPSSRDTGKWLILSNGTESEAHCLSMAYWKIATYLPRLRANNMTMSYRKLSNLLRFGLPKVGDRGGFILPHLIAFEIGSTRRD